MLKRVILILAAAAASSWGASYYSVRLDDPKAIYVSSDSFPVRGDGVTDDTAGIQ